MDGKTALEVAQLNEQADVIKVLEETQAEVKKEEVKEEAKA